MMRRGLVGVLLIGLCGASVAWAQFQTCAFCDVNRLNPDPFRVDPCDTGTITLRGVGFLDTQQNGCNTTPLVDEDIPVDSDQ